MREPRRSKLPHPDAFETTMEALGVRLRDERRTARRKQRGAPATTYSVAGRATAPGLVA